MQKLTKRGLSSRLNLEKQLIGKRNMKREGFLFEKLVSYENIKEAFFNAAKNKKYKKMIHKIEENLDFYILEIQKMLTEETYVPAIPEIMIYNEKLSNKERIISKTPFYPDQIIGHAVIQCISHLLKRGMYYYSCANVPGRGGIHAKKACEKFIRKDPKNTKYCLKLDVKKFYPSIKQENLKIKFRRIIKDDKLLRLLDKIIEITPSGLPIGTYTSQWFANFYLQDLDHFIKEKCGAKYFVRYADDMPIFGPNKRKLYRMKEAIDEFLDVKIKDNWKIFKITDTQCLDFVGYKIYRHKTAIRKRIFKNIRRLMIKLINKIRNHIKILVHEARSFFSYYGYIKNSDSYFIEHTYIRKLNIYRLKKVLHC